VTQELHEFDDDGHEMPPVDWSDQRQTSEMTDTFGHGFLTRVTEETGIARAHTQIKETGELRFVVVKHVEGGDGAGGIRRQLVIVPEGELDAFGPVDERDWIVIHPKMTNVKRAR
jgi:hypothetical protein